MRDEEGRGDTETRRRGEKSNCLFLRVAASPTLRVSPFIPHPLNIVRQVRARLVFDEELVFLAQGLNGLGRDARDQV